MRAESVRMIAVGSVLLFILLGLSVCLLSINGFVSVVLNFFGILLVAVRFNSNGGDQVNKVLAVMLAVADWGILVWFIFGE